MSRTTHHREQKKNWSTPSWWIREFMTVPQRAKVRTWKKKVEKTPIDELDLHEDCPHGRKPHVYYW